MASSVAADIKIDPSNTTEAQIEEFLKGLYAIENLSLEELNEWYEFLRYKGFSRSEVIAELYRKVSDVKIAQQIILLCGIQGPQRAALAKLPNGRTVQSYGIPASGMKGSKGISCQRITAATADLCAFLMKKLNVPKRLNLPCPAWLQFPSAGSITMPDDLRQAHYEFANRFSTVIGGVFNEQIYMQMMTNSYLNPKLKLFDSYSLSEVSALVPVPVAAPVFDPNRGSVGPTKTTASEKVKTQTPKGRG
jgi:hypothetical protein